MRAAADFGAITKSMRLPATYEQRMLDIIRQKHLDWLSQHARPGVVVDLGWQHVEICHDGEWLPRHLNDRAKLGQVGGVRLRMPLRRI